MDENIQIGEVIWFGEKYFGFIRSYNGKEIFFHGRSCKGFNPTENDIVVYFTEPSKRKARSLEAVAVQPLSSLKNRRVVANLAFNLDAKLKARLLNALASTYGNLVDTALPPSEILSELAEIGSVPPISEQNQDTEKLRYISDFLLSALPRQIYSECVELMLSAVSNSTVMELYLNEVIQLIPRTYSEISKIWFNLPQNQQSKIFLDIGSDVIGYRQLFLEGILKINSEQFPTHCFGLLQDLLEKYPNLKGETVDYAAKALRTPVIRLLLWLYDYASIDLDLEEIANSVSILNSQDQQRLLKKLFCCLDQKIPILTYEQFFDLVWTDISTWVALELLETAKNAPNATRFDIEEKVYKTVCKHISGPTDDILISGYFDKCTGRAYCYFKDENNQKFYHYPEPNEKEGDIEKYITRDEIPTHVTWCEGRKSDEPHKKNKQEFWWCGNQQCYEISIPPNGHENYHDYTVWDFLRILNIEYSLNGYQQLLGTLNRIRELFEHMKCEVCGHLMHPVNNSNYSFYRITRFICKNTECANDEEVYLTHCINSRCSAVIDSRQSAKCKPEGYAQDKFGWYICTYCYACCNSTKLAERKHHLEINHREYRGHTEGHRERNEICCVECGNTMELSEAYTAPMIKWLERQQENPSMVCKFGENKHGKWWLIMRSGFKSDERFQSFTEKITTLGMQINVADMPGAYFVSRLGKDRIILKCRQCTHQLDLSEIADNHDFERLNALRYHRLIHKRFPYEKNVDFDGN